MTQHHASPVRTPPRGTAHPGPAGLSPAQQPGPILLISTYELGHQPLNLASPLAFLARAGFTAEAVDTGIATLTRSAVSAAWFIAVSIPMHTATRLAVRLLDQIRDLNPPAYLCCYGLYATANADYLLAAGVDFIIGGEYEEPLVNLVAALSGHGAFPVAGVTSAQVKAPPFLARLAFPVPQRNALPALARYAHFEADDRRVPAGYVEASRGCLHTCLHCPITPVYGGRFFVVPADVVLADIRQQVALGAGHITFGDPDFLNGPGHSLHIVRALHAEFPHVTFDITTKIEHILEFRSLFVELKALGCAFVVSAIEAFSDTILEHLNKGHSRTDIATGLAVLNQAGIPMRPSLMPFTPWTTLDDYLDLLDQVEVLGLIDQTDPVHYSIRLLVPPGSALIEQADAALWLGDLHAADFTYHWAHPDPRLDALHGQVADLVAAAAAAHESPRTTFYRIKALAYATALGRTAPVRGPQISVAEPAPNGPHLTESWFC